MGDGLCRGCESARCGMGGGGGVVHRWCSQVVLAALRCLPGAVCGQEMGGNRGGLAGHPLLRLLGPLAAMPVVRGASPAPPTPAAQQKQQNPAKRTSYSVQYIFDPVCGARSDPQQVHRAEKAGNATTRSTRPPPRCRHSHLIPLITPLSRCCQSPETRRHRWSVAIAILLVSSVDMQNGGRCIWLVLESTCCPCCCSSSSARRQPSPGRSHTRSAIVA